MPRDLREQQTYSAATGDCQCRTRLESDEIHTAHDYGYGFYKSGVQQAHVVIQLEYLLLASCDVVCHGAHPVDLVGAELLLPIAAEVALAAVLVEIQSNPVAYFQAFDRGPLSQFFHDANGFMAKNRAHTRLQPKEFVLITTDDIDV